MLEQIKQAINEWDALDIETRALLFQSNALHKQIDKFGMDRYNLHCKLDSVLAKTDTEEISEEIADLLDDIRETNATIKKLNEEYEKVRKEYNHTWPARKKVKKLKKKFWEQEGLVI